MRHLAESLLMQCDRPPGRLSARSEILLLSYAGAWLLLRYIIGCGTS